MRPHLQRRKGGVMSAPTLTSEEQRDWEEFLSWYRSNGWVETEAAQNAWKDLLSKYPRLKKVEL